MLGGVQKVLALAPRWPATVVLHVCMSGVSIVCVLVVCVGSGFVEGLPVWQEAFPILVVGGSNTMALGHFFING